MNDITHEIRSLNNKHATNYNKVYLNTFIMHYIHISLKVSANVLNKSTWITTHIVTACVLHEL